MWYIAILSYFNPMSCFFELEGVSYVEFLEEY